MRTACRSSQMCTNWNNTGRHNQQVIHCEVCPSPPLPPTWKGFSPVCTSWCRLSLELSTKAFPHSAQTCTRGPWMCKCLRSAALSRNILLQPCTHAHNTGQSSTAGYSCWTEVCTDLVRTRHTALPSIPGVLHLGPPGYKRGGVRRAKVTPAQPSTHLVNSTMWSGSLKSNPGRPS